MTGQLTLPNIPAIAVIWLHTDREPWLHSKRLVTPLHQVIDCSLKENMSKTWQFIVKLQISLEVYSKRKNEMRKV